jgi:hypothetical protein
MSEDVVHGIRTQPDGEKKRGGTHQKGRIVKMMYCKKERYLLRSQIQVSIQCCGRQRVIRGNVRRGNKSLGNWWENGIPL